MNLTTQLLTFAKGGQPLKRTLALAGVLEDPVKFALSGSRSDYRIAVDKDLWAVDADEGQLGQVIQNLVLNASEAMPQGGTVEIAARNEVIAAGGNPLVPAGGDFVRIDVKDSGAGISGQHLARIFDPYFTTKEQGSGLGLATSYSIVRGHDGFIDVTSRLGEGSVFSVYLPASRRRRAGAPEAVAATGEGTGQVLVMDDDGLVREVAEAMLAALGHAVATAASGEEAMELYRRARERGPPLRRRHPRPDGEERDGRRGDDSPTARAGPRRQGRRLERVLGRSRAGRLPVARLLRPPEQTVPARCLEGLPPVTCETRVLRRVKQWRL